MDCKRSMEPLLLLLVLIVSLKEGSSLPLEKNNGCKPGQRQRGNDSVSICCNPAICLELFRKCTVTDGYDVCETCGEGYCRSNTSPYDTLNFQDPPFGIMCGSVKELCDKVDGAQPVYDDRGCVTECKCIDGYYNYDKNSRGCHKAVDPCHRQGEELSEKGVCVECPANKFKDFIVGRCIDKTVCGPDEIMIDVGSTKTDAICQTKSGNTPVPPAGITLSNRSQESTTVNNPVDVRDATTGSDTSGTHHGTAVGTRFPYEWVVPVVAVILIIGVVAVVLRDDERRQRIFRKLSWTKCRCCPCRGDYWIAPDNEAADQDISDGQQQSEQLDLEPVNTPSAEEQHPTADEQSNNDSGNSDSVLCFDSADLPISSENTSSSSENVSRSDSGISNKDGDPHESRNHHETMMSLHNDIHDNTHLTFRGTDVVKDEIRDDTDRSEDVAQLPDDTKNHQSTQDARFKDLGGSPNPLRTPPKTTPVGRVRPMRPILQTPPPDLQLQQPVRDAMERTAMVLNNGASLHHASDEELPDPVVFPDVDLSSETDLFYNSGSLLGHPRQDNCDLSDAPPLFSAETDGLLESQDGHADETSEDETFSKQI